MNHFGTSVVNPLVECVDVDGIVRRIDVNAVMARINIDQVVDRIDMNRLLDRVQWDRHLSRIDWEAAVLDRIDVEQLVLRSNVGAVLSQSTTGFLTQLLDSIRSIVIAMDLLLLRVSRDWMCRKHAQCLPQRPGSTYDDNHMRVPTDRLEKAIAVQGRYTGGCSKAIALGLDVGILAASFAGLLIFYELCRMVWENHGFQNISLSNQVANSSLQRDDNLYTLMAYFAHCGNYFLLSVLLTGQTIGMAIVGIKVVTSASGEPVSPCQALIRTATLPLTITLCPPLVLLGACRRDGRMLHDYLAKTGVVYQWNVRLTKLRHRANRKSSRMDDEVYTSYHPSDSARGALFSSVKKVPLSPTSRGISSSSGDGMERSAYRESSDLTYMTAPDDLSSYV